ncbi:MAG: hypothetical protein JOZ33_14020, partial [Acidobacteriaceae bacterium]|nr:hypothetical protein [Acidobacteriaceae bacterium]
MKLKIKISAIMRPSGIALFAVCLSLVAWLCPDFGVLRKGFTVPENPGLIAWFIVVSWYLLIFAGLLAGQRLGVALASPHRKHVPPPLESVGIYRIFTFLAAFGTASTLVRIFQTLTLEQAALYFYLGQGNRIKNTLYGNYSAGILSLRYLVVYSAALAIYRTIRFRKITFLGVVNIVLLGGTVLISSRL